MTSKRVLDRVDAAVTGIVNGRTATYKVVLDLEVVSLPSSLGGADEEDVERSSVAEGHSVPKGGPYTVTYTYHGKQYEVAGLWGDENGQLVAVKP